MISKPDISSFSTLVPEQMTVSEQAFVLNGLEQLFSFVQEQSLEIQSLRDEINHLKGEDGKPLISGKNQKAVSLTQRNVSSETARKTSGAPRKIKPIKFDNSLVIDEIEKIDFIDLTSLPLDVV